MLYEYPGITKELGAASIVQSSTESGHIGSLKVVSLQQAHLLLANKQMREHIFNTTPIASVNCCILRFQ